MTEPNDCTTWERNTICLGGHVMKCCDGNARQVTSYYANSAFGELSEFEGES
jgi:hypothetical protein